MARVKDTNFTHQNSNKGLRQPLKDLKHLPLSKSEQMKALSRLREIIPNALIFMKEESDTDTGSEGEWNSEKLSNVSHYPHIGSNNERHRKRDSPSAHHPHTASEEKAEGQLSPSLHHNPLTTSGKAGAISSDDSKHNNNVLFSPHNAISSKSSNVILFNMWLCFILITWFLFLSDIFLENGI